MNFTRKDILSTVDLTVDEMLLILNTADSFLEVSTRDIKKVPALRGKTVINLFVEASTRTRTSFEIAGKRLSADTINISGSSSSIIKGETLVDTARNLEAMSPDLVVIRHGSVGAPHMIAKCMKAAVINAGDGANEHPTQALLDLMTIRTKKGRIEGLKIAIVGDISHSRVARSNIHALNKMGADLHLAGPATMLPRDIDKLGVTVHNRLEPAIKDADIVMMLRIQLERQERKVFPSLREYAARFGLNREKLKLAREDALVMHPGPTNRGVEIAPDIADGPQSIILDQVTNGVALRMALLYLLLGGKS